MQYDEFPDHSVGGNCEWRLTSWTSAVRTALGVKALILFRTAFVVVLAPSSLLAFYSVYKSNPAFLILAILSFWGLWTSSTGPTGIGMAASILTAFVGFVFSVITQDRLLAISSMLPGLTWFGSCAILGTTGQYVMDAARTSEETFQNLVQHGILK